MYIKLFYLNSIFKELRRCSNLREFNRPTLICTTCIYPHQFDYTNKYTIPCESCIIRHHITSFTRSKGRVRQHSVLIGLGNESGQVGYAHGKSVHYTDAVKAAFKKASCSIKTLPAHKYPVILNAPKKRVGKSRYIISSSRAYKNTFMFDSIKLSASIFYLGGITKGHISTIKQGSLTKHVLYRLAGL